MRALAVIVMFLGSLSAALAQTGVVKSEGQPLPGVTVRATQGERVLSTLTDANGEFKLANLTPGTWTIDVALFGFAPQRREVQVTANPTKIDFTLQIGNFAGGRGGFGPGRFGAGGRGGGAAPGGFNPGANPANAPNAAPGTTVQADAAQGTLPDAAAPPADVAALQQANAGGANESFLVNGSLSTGLQTQASDFTPGQGPNGLGSGVASAAVGGAPGQGGAAAAGPGGFQGGGGGGGFGGGGFGGPGGGGGFGGGRGPGPAGRGGFIGNRRNAGQNQIRGSIFYTVDNSVTDASPFSLNGESNTKAPYAQNKFGFNLGGPLEIPKLFRAENTFFIINYNGSLGRNGMNLTSTVPTLAERAGDFSGISTVIYNPATGLPFPGNRISQINPIAAGLLKYIPVPNQPGTVNNYRLTEAVPNNSQNLNARVNQTLSSRDQLSFGINWQGRDSQTLQNYGFIDSSSGNGMNANFNYRHTFGTAIFQNFTATFNRNTNLTTPFFANGTDVAAGLGIQGASSNPLNYGPPTLTFTNFGSLTDSSPSQTAVYNLGFTESLSIRRGKHNWTFGGGYTRYFRNSVTDANGRGTFNFTGLATSEINANGQPVANTGLDFADFLLGLPQSDSIRYGSSNTYFRTDSYYLFGQDDFRVRNNLTLNLGLRYEYFAPWSEKYGRIANLDIAPGFSAVSVVTPAQPGLYSGAFSSGLINPDRNNFAPRAGLAWKPWNRKNYVVRMGYGIYYNPGIYNQFTSLLSAQPPFAQSTSVETSTLNPLTLAEGLTVTPDGKTILNTFAVNRNYQTMYAQTWNVGFQFQMPWQLVGEVNYLGTKGTHLDVQEVPNQAPPGAVLTAQQRQSISNATGFTYDTPDGNSIYHALQTRLTRRFRRNVSFNLQYTFSKAVDDSSTLGGVGNTVAQNFNDLSAERGLSSFDRRHVFTMTSLIQSPVGSNGVLANSRFFETALKDWTLSPSVTLETGTPLTARVLGNQSDTAGTGTIGSGRADATGLPIESSTGFFNLAAFTVPVSGEFGNAGRNTIPGPSLFSANLSLQRTITLHERTRLQIRVDANNFTNHVNITSVGTVVNSITYGAPLSAGGMRTLSATLRLNF
ncbi:MAG: TonB-dependent receptor [Acidobacteriota bacterium]|nr:TonB-dependent receptor [Acidobacteriota bacterium]